MIFVKSFKGYEDKLAMLDERVNEWLTEHQVQVMAVNTALSHENEGRAGSGDLIYTVVYKADSVVKD
jgi:Holliday junction resolvasome RuvABC endonuclease subunit